MTSPATVPSAVATPPPSPEGRFTIGAVSHITGIPVGTLRIWERRYGGSLPHRGENNRRQYTQAEVTRLTLIRQLVELGHPVGSVVRLTEAALRERIQFHEQEQPDAIPSAVIPAPRVMVFGETLGFAPETLTGSLDIAGLYPVFAEFEKAALTAAPDVLVAEWLSVTEENLRSLSALARQTAVRRCVLVYTYASRDILAQADRLGMRLLSTPVSAEGLVAACQGQPEPRPARHALQGGQAGDIPARQFTNETLVQLSRLSTDLACECPRHLSELVLKLSAFEAYSLDCENADALNAARHQVLHRITADARALMESALVYLLQAEFGTATPPHAGTGSAMGHTL